MALIKVSSQAELERALEDYKMYDEIEICSSGSYSVTKTPDGIECYITVKGALEVELVSWESSNLTAVSRGSSNLRAVSRESSNLTAESRESSNLTAESWESSNLTAVSRGSSNLRAVSRESSNLTAVSRGSSNLRAESRESSNLTAESWESSNLTAVSRGSSNLTAESWGSSNLRAVSRESSNLTAVSRGSSNLTAVSRGSSNLRAESRESSNLTAESWESSNLRAVSRESSNLRAVSRESSNLTAVSRESSNLTAVSRGSSNLTAESWGSSSISGTAGKYAATINRGAHDRSNIDIPDCIMLPSPDITTPEKWCEYYGAKVEDGAVRLYKAVDANFRSGWKFLYEPGTMPVAPDWDGMQRECGGGLHFCSTPSACHQFVDTPERYIECWVKLEDLVVHQSPEYPTKIKGRAICRPIVEVDVDGEPVKV